MSDVKQEQEAAPPDPYMGAPKPEYIQQILPELFNHYKERNKWIALARAHVEGEHEIEKPAATRFAVKTLHLWNFRSFVNERLARFLPVPRYRVIPSGISDTALGAASKLEKSINGIFYWLRRHNDSWGNCVADVIMFDGGAMRIEMNTQAAYPDLSVNEDDGEDNITRGMPTGDEEATDDMTTEERNALREKANKARIEARENYKKEQGVSKLISNHYVPYEAFFPVPDADVPDEFFEIEFRSVRKIIANKRFDPVVTAELSQRISGNDRLGSFAAQMPIIRYCDGKVYAYYLADEIDTLETNEGSRLQRFMNKTSLGELKFLYAYEHNAGVPLYTHIIGMHGGWVSGNTDKVKGRIKALLETEDKLDELASQAFSNVRETFWPTLKITYSTERPAEQLNDGDNRKMTPRGVEDLELYVGEDVQPLMQARANPIYADLMDRLESTMAKIGGAPGLYGIHQPGVEGGFQESQLLQQADSQYARIEGNIVTGAQNNVLTILALIKAAGEKVWVRSRHSASGQTFFEDLFIDPDELDPIPEIDAVVKARTAGNEATALRTYETATRDVAGPGTAPMDRATARQEILDIEQPDEMETLVQKQTLVDMAWPEILLAEVKKRYNLATVEEIAAENKEEDLAAAMQNDPELAAQMGMFGNGESPPDPAAMMPPPGPGQGVGGGLAVGMPQPEAAQGRTDALMLEPPVAVPV